MISNPLVFYITLDGNILHRPVCKPTYIGIAVRVFEVQAVCRNTVIHIVNDNIIVCRFCFQSIANA